MNFGKERVLVSCVVGKTLRENTMGDNDKILKLSLLTLGDSKVGKSSLLTRFSSEFATFNPTSMPTIGIDYKMKTVEIDGTKIKLQIVSSYCCSRFIISQPY
jgi:GTPase SAR1 family protein